MSYLFILMVYLIISLLQTLLQWGAGGGRSLAFYFSVKMQTVVNVMLLQKPTDHNQFHVLNNLQLNASEAVGLQLLHSAKCLPQL